MSARVTQRLAIAETILYVLDAAADMALHTRATLPKATASWYTDPHVLDTDLAVQYPHLDDHVAYWNAVVSAEPVLITPTLHDRTLHTALEWGCIPAAQRVVSLCWAVSASLLPSGEGGWEVFAETLGGQASEASRRGFRSAKLELLTRGPNRHSGLTINSQLGQCAGGGGNRRADSHRCGTTSCGSGQELCLLRCQQLLLCQHGLQTAGL